MKNILIFLVITVVLNSCLSYDRLTIYHKDFEPEVSKSLRFDGYYLNIITDDESENYLKTRCPNGLTPIFFYTDGSVFHNLSFCNQDSLKNFIYNNRTSPFLWAIFDCKIDSITIEAYSPNTGTFNYDRYYLKGIIKTDSIIFTQQIDRKMNVEDIYEVFVFKQFDVKPDSQQNFIKNKRRFNK